MRAAHISLTGCREENQDAAVYTIDNGLLVAGVFDGLGGHSGGSLAARTAGDAALCCAGEPLERLERANLAVLAKQMESGLTSMRTTAVLLMIKGDTALWAHCGDSRLYRFRDGLAQQLTLDHSVPQALVRQGEIRPEDIRFHEDRARLTRALGVPEARVSGAGDTVLSGDRYLLCSDGFWEPVTEREMEDCLSGADSPQSWLARAAHLIERANDPRQDNYTAVAVFIDS